MEKYMTCFIEPGNPGGRSGYFVFCQRQMIYESNDPMYMVMEVILNSFDKQGWSLHQALSEGYQAILIFKRTGM